MKLRRFSFFSVTLVSELKIFLQKKNEQNYKNLKNKDKNNAKAVR
jgi:hypothetical protein